MTNITCNISSDGTSVLCNGTEYVKEEGPLTVYDGMFWMYVSVYIALVLFAGLMSGLTLGLLSLDMTSLLVLKEAGTPKQKRYASKIIPLVKRHHLLLVTLLLANAAAVETMPLFLDRVSDPVTAILVSVTAVLFFGEVFPQALCSRFGLAIGATLAPLVYVMQGICFIIAFPISKLLDCMLGRDHATFFRRSELKALVDLHGPTGVEGHDELTYDEVLIIKGALELRDKVVHDAMVPLENVFMLEVDSVLNSEIVSKILKETHSRIPVYESRRQNIVGVLLVKTLVCHDASGTVTLRSLLKDKRVSRRVHFVGELTPLYDLLNIFQKGKTHLAVVTRSIHMSETTHTVEVSMQQPSSFNDTKEVVGIITLEDILEELLQEEIIDETDVYIDVRNRIKVARAKTFLGRSTSSIQPYDTFGSRSTVTTETHPTPTRRYLSIPNERENHDQNRLRSNTEPNRDADVTTPLLGQGP